MSDHSLLRHQITTLNSGDLPQQFFKKSHELVFSQLGLSAREHDMMALFLTRLHKEHWTDYLEKRHIYAPSYTFGTDVLKEWFDLNSKQIYPTLKPVADRLSGRKVGVINDGEEAFDFIPLFSRVTYKNSELTIVPNPELITAYIDYSAGHAQINHLSFRRLKSEHAKRLYILFSRFKSKGYLHPQPIKVLHGLFGLLDEKGRLIKQSYSQNKVFIERCIKKPIAEMMACPEVNQELSFDIDPQTGMVGYYPVMTGRKIVEIGFHFRWKNTKSKECEFQPTYENALDSYYALLEGKNVFTKVEMDNLKHYWMELTLVGLDTGPDMIRKLKMVNLVT